MAMECPRCKYIAENDRLCPQCGAPMRLSLLADHRGGSDETKKVQIVDDRPPGFLDRVVQVLIGELIVHVVASMLVAAFIITASSMKVTPKQIPTKWPMAVSIASVVIPCVSVVIACIASLRGVYLAQVVSAVIGVISALTLNWARVTYGFPPTLMDWIIVPPVCGLVGFAVGLRLAGQLQTSQKVEYRKIDTWDPRARTAYSEYDISLYLRMRRVGWGILVGMLAAWVIKSGISTFLAPAYSNPGAAKAAVEKAAFPINMTSAMLGGMIAAIGTRAGITQGLLAGWGMLLVRNFLTPVRDMETLVAMALFYTFFPAIGGVFGRIIFKPMRRFRGENDQKLS